MSNKFTYTMQQLLDAFNGNISDRSIRRWIKSGKLIEGREYIRPNSKLLFDLGAVTKVWMIPRAKRR